MIDVRVLQHRCDRREFIELSFMEWHFHGFGMRVIIVNIDSIDDRNKQIGCK